MIYFGIDDLCYFILKFTFDIDGRWWRLNKVRYLVWCCRFKHGNMKDGVYTMESVQETDRVRVCSSLS